MPSLLFSALLLQALASQPVQARTPEPEAAGFSAERLEGLRAFVASEMERGRIAGAVTLVARGDRIAFFEASGLADIASGTPMEKDALFRIRSMTKPVVSLAALLLHEEGRFLLDDPGSKFLPELAGLRVIAEGATADDPRTVAAEREVTILDLLTHRAGFAYGFINQGPVGELYRRADLLTWDMTAQELVERLAELPLVRQPGRRHEYSHATDVLGRLVEVVSGERLDVFLRRRILDPLGMRDTYFYLPSEKASRLVTLYRTEDGSAPTSAETWEESPFVVGPRKLFSGGGGLVSTAPDYLRFLRMLLNGGALDGVRIASPKTIELMTADHVGHEIGIHPGYGFGLGVAVRRPTGGVVLGSVGEYTWGGIDNTVFWVDPQEGLILLFMTNTTPYDLYQRWYFKTAVYQALVEAR